MQDQYRKYMQSFRLSTIKPDLNLNIKVVSNHRTNINSLKNSLDVNDLAFLTSQEMYQKMNLKMEKLNQGKSDPFKQEFITKVHTKIGSALNLLSKLNEFNKSIHQQMLSCDKDSATDTEDEDTDEEVAAIWKKYNVSHYKITKEMLNFIYDSG